MKNILLVLIFMHAAVLSMPAKRTPTLTTQPDGTQFSLIGFGDERYSFSETLDGYVIVQGADRFWYYAVLSPEGTYTPGDLRVGGSADAARIKARRGISRHLRESPAVISAAVQKYEREHPAGSTVQPIQLDMKSLMKTGATVRRELVLCVKYPDLANTYTAQSFQDMINDDTWNSGIGGMSRYFEEVTYNALSVQADYQDWITAANASSYYAKNNANYSDHVKELVKQCIDAAEANGVNFADYDNDGDGVVDGVFIIHAGKGAEEGSDNNYIWSHAGSISTISPTYDGKTFNKYIVLPEKYSDGHVDIGVFCHEYGHMIGLPDTYDTDGVTNGSSEGVGQWCLMAGGAWGGDGSSPERPVHMSAYCKALLGCITPTVVSASQALSIPQAETNASTYKIWMDINQSDEYMLIENRQKTGFDANLPGSGLLIYHIDRNLTDIYPYRNEINITNTRMGIKVYEADGLEHLATDINRGDAGDPYPGSANNTSLTSSTVPNSKLWNGTSSGVEITNISSSSSTMTATAVVPVYYGSPEQFYRKFTGTSYSTYSYGMVKCTPAYNGKLMGIRVVSPANKYVTVSAAAFTTFSSNMLSSQVGSTVSGASAAITNFVQLDFSPAIDVTQAIPIYVRVHFQPASGNYLPLDGSSTVTGNSYRSTDGTTFTRMTSYDIPVRAVFQSTTALPVEIASFAAAVRGTTATLSWNTATEFNNYGFEVERRSIEIRESGTVPTEWQTIGFVQGAGSSSSPKEYSFADSRLTAGRYAYRLKQVDVNGTIAYSQSVEIDIAAAAEYMLSQNYPNPFNPETKIAFSIPTSSVVTLTVFDPLGRTIAVLVNGHTPGGSHEAVWNASGVSSGVYFYRLEAGSFASTKKLLLLR